MNRYRNTYRYVCIHGLACIHLFSSSQDHKHGQKTTEKLGQYICNIYCNIVLISPIYKELLKIKGGKVQKATRKNRQKMWAIHRLKKDIKMALNYMKRVISLIIREKQIKSTPREWINKFWYIHSMEFYLSIKRKKILVHTTWMNLRSVMLSERCQTQKSIYYLIPFV